MLVAQPAVIQDARAKDGGRVDIEFALSGWRGGEGKENHGRSTGDNGGEQTRRGKRNGKGGNVRMCKGRGIDDF